MEYFISNLEDSLKYNVPIVSLTAAFILIDAISAIDSADGIADRTKFKNWFKEYLAQYIIFDITETDYYLIRCSLLHQLSGSQEDAAITTLLFLPTNCNFTGHLNVFNKALHLSLSEFVMDVSEATKKCILESKYYHLHKDKIITLHMNGLFPYVEGCPVIASKKPAKRKK